LTARLNEVFDHVKAIRQTLGAGRVIDVGTDHGQLAVRCLKEQTATSVICTDINEGPLERCRENLEKNNLQTKAQTKLTDGLDGIDLHPKDIVVIAGLGGLNSVDILKKATERTSQQILEQIAFVLQPQKSTEELRQFLYKSGMELTDETAVFDRGFYYVVMSAKFTGKTRDLSIPEQYIGPLLTEHQNNPKYTDYFDFLKRVLSKRARSDKNADEALKELSNNID